MGSSTAGPTSALVAEHREVVAVVLAGVAAARVVMEEERDVLLGEQRATVVSRL